ncbi:hypothetical protein LCGC14_1035850 [marine sediment metagenome]|uniref:PD-(D/E)XK endonuclease-like domain-containing protein n=1 Tax=marine sediment metagenome TaxID=412755 RepID=A0A0F9MT82_9ZZZZ
MKNVIPEALPDVTGEIKASFEKDIRKAQPMSNWASKLGHPCLRHLVHHRLDWDKTEKHDVGLELIFNGGKVLEQAIAKPYLERAGYEIVEMDRSIQTTDNEIFRKAQINGKLDFICRKDGFEFPVEAKTMAPHIFNKVESIEDLLFSKHVWHRQYPGQLMMYLLGKNYDVGMFILINKVNFEPKHIWLHQDYTYAEELIQKATRVNEFVAKKEYPDRINYDPSVCGKCEFANVCLGDIDRTEAELVTDAYWPEMLEEYLQLKKQLKPLKSRYEELDEMIKKRFEGVEKAIVDNFLVTGRWIDRKSFTVEAKRSWRKDVREIESQTITKGHKNKMFKGMTAI